jgi:hypothetical protein
MNNSAKIKNLLKLPNTIFSEDEIAALSTFGFEYNEKDQILHCGGFLSTENYKIKKRLSLLARQRKALYNEEPRATEIEFEFVTVIFDSNMMGAQSKAFATFQSLISYVQDLKEKKST